MATASPPTTQTGAAARAVDASKVYGTGEAAVRALDHISVEFARKQVHRHHGSVGLGEVDAAALPRRARRASPTVGCSSVTSRSARRPRSS